jgi:hypothetical protein
MPHDTATVTPHFYFRSCGTHLTVTLHIFMSCHKVWSTTDSEILVRTVFLSQSSICLHPCAVQLWQLTSLREWTQNVHHDAFYHLTLFHLWMPVPIFQLFWGDTVHSPNRSCRCAWHSHAFLCGELVLAHINAVPLYRLSFGNEISNAKILVCEMRVYSSTYIAFWW